MISAFMTQFFVGFVLLFVFFVFVIELRAFCLRLAKHGGAWVPVAKIIFYPIGAFFLACDVGFNIVYAPLLFKFERANKYGEGWTVTARVKYHKAVGFAELESDIKPGWNFRVAIFICRRFLEPVDPGHCG